MFGPGNAPVGRREGQERGGGEKQRYIRGDLYYRADSLACKAVTHNRIPGSNFIIILEENKFPERKAQAVPSRSVFASCLT